MADHGLDSSPTNMTCLLSFPRPYPAVVFIMQLDTQQVVVHQDKLRAILASCRAQSRVVWSDNRSAGFAVRVARLGIDVDLHIAHNSTTTQTGSRALSISSTERQKGFPSFLITIILVKLVGLCIAHVNRTLHFQNPMSIW
jgi:hypothetical protein